MAEHTSDLSTTEEVCIRGKKTTVPDPPMYSSHNIMEISSVQKGKTTYLSLFLCALYLRHQ